MEAARLRMAEPLEELFETGYYRDKAQQLRRERDTVRNLERELERIAKGIDRGQTHRLESAEERLNRLLTSDGFARSFVEPTDTLRRTVRYLIEIYEQG